jgi:hypothetical protein
MSWGDSSDMYEAAEIRSTHPLYQYFPGCLSLDPGDYRDKIACVLPRGPSATLAFQQEALRRKGSPSVTVLIIDKRFKHFGIDAPLHLFLYKFI